VLDVGMTKPKLKPSCVMTGIGQEMAAGVP
jgi:hypothetical protein